MQVSTAAYFLTSTGAMTLPRWWYVTCLLGKTDGGWTVADKENNVCNIYLKQRGNKTDAMPLSEDSDNRSSGGVPAGSEPVRLDNPDPEDPGGAHDPMRDDAMDGEELMVPRVPKLPPEPSARQISEHELTGHAVYRSWCRHCVASKADKMCCRSCTSSVGTVQLDAWVRQFVDRKVCVRLREFVPDCIHQEFEVQENPGEIRQ